MKSVEPFPWKANAGRGLPSVCVQASEVCVPFVDGLPPNLQPKMEMPQANSWTYMSPSGTMPDGRVLHTAIWDDSGKRMWIFGGFGSSPALRCESQWLKQLLRCVCSGFETGSLQYVSLSFFSRFN